MSTCRPNITSDPEGWAGWALSKVRTRLVQVEQRDEASRKHLYVTIGMATFIARRAHSSTAVLAALRRGFKELTNKTTPEDKIDYAVAILARAATTSKGRRKASKMGRAITSIRGLPLHTPTDIADYIETQGGLEKLLARAKQQPAPSPTKLLVTCTAEQLQEVREREGESVFLQVRVGMPDSSGRKPVELIGVMDDADSSALSPNASFDPHPSASAEDKFGLSDHLGRSGQRLVAPTLKASTPPAHDRRGQGHAAPPPSGHLARSGRPLLAPTLKASTPPAR